MRAKQSRYWDVLTSIQLARLMGGERVGAVRGGLEGREGGSREGGGKRVKEGGVRKG
jgi:hypothetical protein